MSEEMCNERGCGAPATKTYSWPGAPPRQMYGCDKHARKARAVMWAMGYELPMKDVGGIGERTDGTHD